MTKRLLHTPEGVRDIYNNECAKKDILQSKLMNMLKSFGFARIQTPTFEFFDIFSGERGSIPSSELYKFFDRDGNTLVLRPDITPAIARAVSKYYKDETIPLKFSYLGGTYINNNSLQLRMKETTQIGCELIGDSDVNADGEVIALAAELMLESGLDNFQIELGHAGFLKSLLNETMLDDEAFMSLKSLIENKNYFGIEEFVETHSLSEGTKNALLNLPALSGTIEILDKAEKISTHKSALDAIKRLKDIYAYLEMYGVSRYVTFDLGMFLDLDYYTGVIFRGYTYGTGDAIVRGGRYDNLIKQFGKDAASVGLAITIDELMLALDRQGIAIPVGETTDLVLYTPEQLEIVVKAITPLRKNGINISLIQYDTSKTIEEYISYCKTIGINKIIRPINLEEAYVTDIIEDKTSTIFIKNLY